MSTTPSKRGNSSTPEKSSESAGSSQNSDSGSTTPAKKKTRFSLWKSKSNLGKDKDGSVTAVCMQDLTVGTYKAKMLQFRVIGKSELNGKEPKLAIHFIASDGTTAISVVAFGETATMVHEQIRINEVFTMTNFSVEKENPTFSMNLPLKVEIQIGAETSIQKIYAEESYAPATFEFNDIDKLETMAPKCESDFIGIIFKIWDPEEVQIGSTKKWKRDVTLTDRTKKTLLVTLWNNSALKFQANPYSVLAILRGTVGNYKGDITLGANFRSTIWSGPDIDAARQLMDWFDTQKHDLIDVDEKEIENVLF